MYALNKDGNRTGQSITIQDRAIFDGLTATGEASDYAASFTGGNPTELASVFLLAQITQMLNGDLAGMTKAMETNMR